MQRNQDNRMRIGQVVFNLHTASGKALSAHATWRLNAHNAPSQHGTRARIVITQISAAFCIVAAVCNKKNEVDEALQLRPFRASKKELTTPRISARSPIDPM